MIDQELISSFKSAKDIKKFVSLQKARNDLIEFAKYIYPSYEDPEHVKRIAEALQRVEAGEQRRLMVFMPPRHGKEIAHCFQVLTPDGIRKHGDLRVGDFVFGRDGKPTKIVSLSEETTSDCRVNFSDGSFVDCHENHEWLIYDRGYSKKYCEKYGYSPYRVVETKSLEKRKLISKDKKTGKIRCSVQLPLKPKVSFPEKTLPLSPYFFGAWLGDGTTTSPTMCCAEKDKIVIESIGYSYSSSWKHKTTGVIYFYFSNIIQILKKLGVTNGKFIPEVYKYSSIEQRLQLLAGLIDTDGHVEPKTGRVRIATASERLADDICEIIWTLGWHPCKYKQEPTTSISGIVGKKTVFYVGFQPDCDIPTKIPRKKITKFKKQKHIGIVSVERIDPKPGRCIQVEEEDGIYLVGKECIPTHNSLLCSQIFPCWFLGKDPTREVLCISYNNDMATRFGRKTRGLFRSPEFKEVFPGIEVSHESKAADNWELKYTTIENDVERIRDGGVFQAAGIDGEVTGKGANLILIDDPVKGRANADSEAVRTSTWNFYESDLYSRQLSGCAIVVIQTRWHQDDLAGRLLERMKDGGEQWEILELPVFLDKEEKITLWPEKFPPAEMQRYRKTMTNRTWQSLYMQSPVADEGNIIKRNWWIPWKTDDNKEKPLPDHWDFILLSVDTAYTIQEHGSYSAISVWGIFKQNNGTPGIMLLDCFRDRLEYPDLRKKILEYNDNWDPDVLCIEKKASGQSLSQDLKRLLLPVVDFRPDKDKMTRAQSAAAMISAGLVFYVPNKYNQDMIDECANFPTGKTDDLVDTMSQALILIRENNYLNTKRLYRDYDEIEDRNPISREHEYY